MLHEELIGVLGSAGLQEVTYAKIAEKKELQFDVTDGWLGITDNYWAAVLDFFYKLTGNFGVAILIVTLIIKGLFFPLASKSGPPAS